jgi:adenylate cyclase class 2
VAKLVHAHALGACSFGIEGSSPSPSTFKFMQTEFEATFYPVDSKDIRRRLHEAGAVLIYPEYLMKRVVFNPPKPTPFAWLRVRQEAEKTTMSYKMVSGSRIEDQKEIQLVIDDFQKGIDFLAEIGAERKSYQETKRELWKIGEVEITIDTWPGLKPLVEIEAGGEEEVKIVSEKLGFDYSQAYFGAVDGIYEKELGIRVDVLNHAVPEITFENPPKA